MRSTNFSCKSSYREIQCQERGFWLPLDSDGGLDLRAEKPAADADEAIGSLGEGEPLAAVMAAPRELESPQPIAHVGGGRSRGIDDFHAGAKNSREHFAQQRG